MIRKLHEQYKNWGLNINYEKMEQLVNGREGKDMVLGPNTIRDCVRFNPLTPNDHYSGRTAPLTSKRCILYIYLTNTGTEYFKHGIYSPFFLFKMQFVS